MARLTAALCAVMSLAAPTLAAQSLPGNPSLRLRLVRQVDGRLTEVFSIMGAFARADGSLVVGDPEGLKVLMVGANGRVHNLGRAGEGPGEFRNIRAVGEAANDGIWVADSRLLRMQVFQKDGSFREAFSYPRQLTDLPSGQFIARPVGMTSTGVIIMTASFVSGKATGWAAGLSFRDEALLAADSTWKKFEVFLWESGSKTCRPEVRRVFIPVPFCTGGILAMSPDGRFAASVTEAADRETNGQVDITVYSVPIEAEVWRAKIALQPRLPVHKAELDSFNARLAPWLNSNRSSGVVEAYENLAKPRYHPSFDYVLVLNNGELWLSQPSSEGRALFLYGARGSAKGKVTIQRAELPIAAADGVLWTQESDADGFLTLRLYRVERR